LIYLFHLPEGTDNRSVMNNGNRLDEQLTGEWKGDMLCHSTHR